MAKKRIISLNAMDKLLRGSGSLRVSQDAKEALADYLEEKAREIGASAKKVAEHAKRKTVTAKDIELTIT